MTRHLYSISLFSALIASVATLANSQILSSNSTISETSDLTSVPIALEIENSPLILIAEVVPQPERPLPERKSEQSPNLNFQEELDRAREETNETARSYIGIDLGPVRYLETIETLKGPNTELLSLPTTDADLEASTIGDRFLIMMGSQHPDAIRPISGLDDPWVTEVKNHLSRD